MAYHSLNLQAQTARPEPSIKSYYKGIFFIHRENRVLIEIEGQFLLPNDVIWALSRTVFHSS